MESCLPSLSPGKGRCAERAKVSEVVSKLRWSWWHSIDDASQPTKAMSVKKWSPKRCFH